MACNLAILSLSAESPAIIDTFASDFQYTDLFVLRVIRYKYLLYTGKRSSVAAALHPSFPVRAMTDWYLQTLDASALTLTRSLDEWVCLDLVLELGPDLQLETRQDTRLLGARQYKTDWEPTNSLQNKMLTVVKRRLLLPDNL